MPLCPSCGARNNLAACRGRKVVRRQPAPQATHKKDSVVVRANSLAATSSSGAAFPAPVRDLELARLQFVSLKGIDQINQCFHASIFVEFVIRGGAADEDLADVQNDEWAGPASGKRPSASWYIKQFEVVNDVSPGGAICVLKSRAFVRNSDIIMQYKADGSFGEAFELNNFPFDTQDMTVKFTVACANQGLTPVRIVPPHTERPFLMPEANFAGHNSWMMSAHVWWNIGEHEFDPSEQRQFPCLEFCVTASRKPGYYVWNVGIPMLVFMLLTVCSFAVPVDTVGDRLAASLALVLTCSAYKFSVAAMVPAVSYLTLLDQYVLTCSAYLAFVVFENALVGWLATRPTSSSWWRQYDDEEAAAKAVKLAEDVDLFFLIFGFVVIVATHVYFGVRWRRALRENDDKIKSNHSDQTARGKAHRAQMSRKERSAWEHSSGNKGKSGRNVLGSKRRSWNTGAGSSSSAMPAASGLPGPSGMVRT